MPLPPRSPRFSLSVFLDSVANRLVSRLLYLLRPVSLIWFAPVLLLPLFLLTPVVSGRALVLLQENPPSAQQAAPAQPVQNPPAPAPAAPSQAQPASSAPATPAAEFAPITESDLQHRLAGKQLFLRGGWLGDSLNFTEHGDPVGHPATGSYTLSAIQIDKVHLTKHRVELEGSRYALHFLGALPYEDSANAVDRIRITPKKKTLKITIDREIVIKSKKASKAERAAEKAKKKAAEAPAGQPAGQSGVQAVASSESDAPAATPAPTTTQALAANAPAPSQSQPGQAESAADLEPEKPGEAAAADQASVTTTVSPAHAALILHQALDKIFATGLDENMRARMPEFWQLYYQAQAAGVDYRPKDVLRANAVDQQAKLLSFVSPLSNDYAQSSTIAGPALYRVVVGPDGVPQQIAVERPIGFGFDENAVAALRKATFQPAVKGGQPVAQALDLTVVFRIYSQRTSQSSSDAASDNSSGTGTPVAAPTVKPVLPGPYSAKPVPAQPATDQPVPATDQPAQPQPDQPQPAQPQPDSSQPAQPQPDPAKPTQPQ